LSTTTARREEDTAMSETRILDSDIVTARSFEDIEGKHPVVATLFWGDQVKIVGRAEGGPKAEIPRREWNEAKKRYETKIQVCVLPRGTRFRDEPLLKVRVIDVGQGDGAMIETPKGQFVLVDGGEEQHLRRYIAVAFAHLTRSRPLSCSAIVVTHGDADHFAGLTKLLAWGAKGTGRKPLVSAERVFHNGLVKRDGKAKQPFGKEVKVGTEKYAVELEEDLRAVSEKKMNKPFREWRAALAGLKTASGGKPRIRRLGYGDDSAFDFLAEEDNLSMRVLGPIVEEVNGKPALPFLGDASHTINGHSIVLKLTYGNVRFLFGADLNTPSEERLMQRAQADAVSLTAEVLKVPHHGSADFSPRMLEAVRPVVSVVSSGDESAAKEYIHPRAGLVGALGKYSRATVDKPLVYVTEMVAFFQRLKEGTIVERVNKSTERPVHNAYRKAAFGIVHVRTDGTRVLVVTHSGKDDKKESYAFRVNERGEVELEPDVRPVR
jgi:beta-lactamase superfamily II metal-dependent hydrolase